jgi:hypothetical protein
MIYNSPYDPKKLIDITFTPETVEDFVALVRADEREACAKAVDDFLTSGRSPLGRSVAAAIRARGNT